eukprot:CCRYP_006387-RC/>CCRYP_006387-RC protein AED:0.04 eAED:0.04 QI:2461/0.66/0.75/1/0.33/0/4/1210/128
MDDSMVVKGTPVVSASAVPSPPPGMLAKTTTTKYPDGREVTSTEFVPAESVTASATSAAAAPQTVRAPPVGIRRDLGYDPVSITCQYCNQPTPTRTVKDIVQRNYTLLPEVWKRSWQIGCQMLQSEVD